MLCSSKRGVRWGGGAVARLPHSLSGAWPETRRKRKPAGTRGSSGVNQRGFTAPSRRGSGPAFRRPPLPGGGRALRGAGCRGVPGLLGQVLPLAAPL